MPKKGRTSEIWSYPFSIVKNETRVMTREGNGVVVDRNGEWLIVRLDLKKRTIRTSIFLVDQIC